MTMIVTISRHGQLDEIDRLSKSSTEIGGARNDAKNPREISSPFYRSVRSGVGCRHGNGRHGRQLFGRSARMSGGYFVCGFFDRAELVFFVLAFGFGFGFADATFFAFAVGLRVAGCLGLPCTRTLRFAPTLRVLRASRQLPDGSSSRDSYPNMMCSGTSGASPRSFAEVGLESSSASNTHPDLLLLVRNVAPCPCCRHRGYRQAMSAIIDREFARAFATEWIAAWNSGDLERIFALYCDDFEMQSPLIAERGFSTTGVLRGKDAIRPYWGGGIAAAMPPLHFELLDAFGGMNTIAIHYRSVGRKYVVEVLELDANRLAIRGSACYGAEAAEK